MRGLKVGDVVCDCRFRHVRIGSIGPVEYGDRDIITEDGSGCSAIHCCGPADHVEGSCAEHAGWKWDPIARKAIDEVDQTKAKEI